MPVISKYRQKWVDIALQELGDEERLFELVDLNDVGITDDLLAGTEIQIPDSDTEKKNIINILRKALPASCEGSDSGGIYDGIEYWGIEFDFIIS